ncbi:helix-turn-helix transcriptional regulator [Yersinia intermedia]|uniref:helix-turn-helix transcriptional regulator n=1 Tax=Yersinia intermedia TaxID=631 RepID=UPI0005DF7357|nr:helix-turn-helix transcriptional regulator [Yersinia intermedia]MCB5313136.1 helix-turn-helix transcriptional regulator [Yersinia intermedia]MCB5327017.1 helix-turn-helix transcriptional regulator [Yersinia intermedia]UNK23802.1 helix-turn-helix transcriptional regulator [Yersinia intermedia]UZM71419.1 helix-turn-helix transcriptional regulator [Yersinia intermedia]CNC56910.1 putative transcriptional regulator [Yersinia intermedia]
MDYPIKILSQLRPTLIGFRKQKGLTQASLAQLLGITQQSYAKLEADPASASIERLFKVLQLLDVELILCEKKNVRLYSSKTHQPEESQTLNLPSKQEDW